MKSKTVLVRVSLATAPAILIDCPIFTYNSWPGKKSTCNERCPPEKHHINPRLPEVTLLPEVGYIIPQSNLVNYAAPRIEKANFSPVFYVVEVKESISDIFTELPCLLDLEILGQLPDTVVLVASISAISTFFMFSRSGNLYLAVSQSYCVLCSGDLENPGQLPVWQVLEGTDD